MLKIKAEAIAAHSISGTNKEKILIATDNDESGSELLEGELEW